MRMLFKSGLAVAVAGALFAATWAVCEQLVGLGAGTSVAMAGVLLAIVVSGLAFWALCRPQVLRPGQWTREWDVWLQPADERHHRRNEQPYEGPEVLGKSTRQHAPDTPTPQGARMLVTEHIKLIVDDVEFEVQKGRRTAVTDVWEEYLRVQWSAVTAIGFATGRHDPIVALYVRTAAGVRYHVADSGFLSRSEWAQLGQLIVEATHGRLILNLAERDNPRSMPQDW